MTHTPVAPRHPRAFAGVTGRAARTLTTAFSALALAIGALAVAPAPAHADEITSQEYVSYYHLGLRLVLLTLREAGACACGE